MSTRPASTRSCTPRDDILLEDLDGADPSGHDFHFVCAEGPFDSLRAHGPRRTARRGRLPRARGDRVGPGHPAVGRPVPAAGRPPAPPHASHPRCSTRTRPPARAPWWSPPARLDARSSSVLSLLCGLVDAHRLPGHDHHPDHDLRGQGVRGLHRGPGRHARRRPHRRAALAGAGHDLGPPGAAQAAAGVRGRRGGCLGGRRRVART